MMDENKIKVIIDTDMGSDDAAALICAVRSGNFDILGVTTVFGNDPVVETVKRTLMMRELLKADFAVYKGCAEPLARRIYDDGMPVGVRESRTTDEQGNTVGYHDVFDLPEPNCAAEKTNAVTWLIETLRKAEEPITVIGLGALTNFGCALRLAPDIAEKVREFVIMGGGLAVTNKTMAAEGNFLRDPEAACIVLECGAPVTIMTVDATHGALMDERFAAEMRTIGSAEAKLIADTVEMRIKAYEKLDPISERRAAALHDVSCVLYLLDSTVAMMQKSCFATVSIDHGMTAGELLVDRRFAAQTPNATVVTMLNEEKMQNMMLKMLR